MLEGHVPPELAMARKVLGMANLTMVGIFVTKLGFSAIKTAVAYVAKNGILNSAKKAAKRVKMWFGHDGLTGRAGDIKRRKPDAPSGSCGLCFRSGTLVWGWGLGGLVAIESLAVGDLMHRREDRGAAG